MPGGLDPRRGPASGQHPDPGDHLFEAERLGHIVVPAGGQATHAVDHRVAGGEEEDGRVAAVGPEPDQRVEAVHAGHHHVQHHHIRAERAGQVHGAGPVVGGCHLESLERQAHLEEFHDPGLVVAHQYPGGGGLGAARGYGHSLPHDHDGAPAASRPGGGPGGIPSPPGPPPPGPAPPGPPPPGPAGMLASLSSFSATPIVIATSYPVSGDPVTVGI